MNTETGFIQQVAKDLSGREYAIIGVKKYTDNENTKVVLVDDIGNFSEIGKNIFESGFKSDNRLKIVNLPEDIYGEVHTLAPVMRHYTGTRCVMIGVAKQSLGAKKIAIYKPFDGEGVYSLPLDKFYDLFTISGDIAYSSFPVNIDDESNLGYIVNLDSVDQDSYPTLLVKYLKTTGDLVFEDFGLY